jgi:hypothetical protein
MATDRNSLSKYGNMYGNMWPFSSKYSNFCSIFSQKKVVVQFELGFFIVKMKKIAQKVTNQRPKYYKTTLVHPKSCKFEWYNLVYPKFEIQFAFKFDLIWFFEFSMKKVTQYFNTLYLKIQNHLHATTLIKLPNV